MNSSVVMQNHKEEKNEGSQHRHDQQHLTTISHYSSSSLSSPISNNHNIHNKIALSRSSSFQSTQSSKDDNNSSSYTRQRVFFGNKVFAPPPPFPASLQVIKSKLYHQTNKAAVKSTLPPYHEIKHSGHALARFSVKSRLTKKWRPTFWIAQGRHKLLFFRSEADFDEWAANPYLTSQERNQLVKLTIDFINDVYKAGNNNLRGYRASPIQSKFVKIQQRQRQQQRNTNHGDDDDDARKMASHFSLERWTSSKVPSVLVEIGGTDAGQVGALHIILVEMIQSSGKEYILPTTTKNSKSRQSGGRNDASSNQDVNSISSSGHGHGNGSVWELRTVGSTHSSGIIGYSFSNLSCTSSIPSNHDDDDDDGPYSDFECDRRDDDELQEWNTQQEQRRGGMHEITPRQQQQEQDVYSPRTSSSPPLLQNLGSRIMMRMRSRSPSTRARRFKELQQEEEQYTRTYHHQEEAAEAQVDVVMKEYSNVSLSHSSPRRSSNSMSGNGRNSNVFNDHHNHSENSSATTSWFQQQQQQDHNATRRPPTPLRNRPPLSPYNTGISSTSIH
jgi:hypothetical protein